MPLVAPCASAPRRGGSVAVGPPRRAERPRRRRRDRRDPPPGRDHRGHARRHPRRRPDDGPGARYRHPTAGRPSAAATGAAREAERRTTMSLTRAVDLRPEDLAGRTWAGYIRESTVGQADRYGPAIQRAEQERFALRHGLRATGREYVDLVSGKEVLGRTDFARMLADAEAGAFEVLL